MANAVVSGTRLIRAKSSDQNWTNDTLADITDLTFAIAANQKVRIRGHVQVYPTGTTGSFKFGFNGPASPTNMAISIFGYEDGSPSTLNAGTWHSTYVSTAMAFTTATQNNHIFFEGVFENGTNAGTFACRGAQSTTDASATTVMRGSHVEVEFLP